MQCAIAVVDEARRLAVVCVETGLRIPGERACRACGPAVWTWATAQGRADITTITSQVAIIVVELAAEEWVAQK